MQKTILGKGLVLTNKPTAIRSLVVRDGIIIRAESGPAFAVRDGERAVVTFPDGKTIKYKIYRLHP